MKKIPSPNHWRTIILVLAFLTLGACSALHDGKGFEHKPGEPAIRHGH